MSIYDIWFWEFIADIFFDNFFANNNIKEIFGITNNMKINQSIVEK